MGDRKGRRDSEHDAAAACTAPPLRGKTWRYRLLGRGFGYERRDTLSDPSTKPARALGGSLRGGRLDKAGGGSEQRELHVRSADTRYTGNGVAGGFFKHYRNGQANGKGPSTCKNAAGQAGWRRR